MDDPKKSEAALRANDPKDMAEGGVEETSEDPKPDAPPVSEDELPAEAAPELRDIPMKGGIDRPDGRRGA